MSRPCKRIKQIKNYLLSDCFTTRSQLIKSKIACSRTIDNLTMILLAREEIEKVKIKDTRQGRAQAAFRLI